jgi:hypothetical protein
MKNLNYITQRISILLILFIFSFGFLLYPLKASADVLPLPWPAPGSPPLPPDYTVPYLPAVNPVCPSGQMGCFYQLDQILRQQRQAVGCSHDAMFADAYVTVTDNLIGAVHNGVFQRPDRVTHEARQYAQEYLDQYQRWYNGDKTSISPSWQIAYQASVDQTNTGLGDLLLQLNAHIRRDNPIRAVEQSEGVLRLDGPMPAASGRYDHNQVSEVLQDTLQPMLDHSAQYYDPTVDDGADLFGMVMDQKGLYALISSWREESWRNAEELRHARADGGVNGASYQAKLAEIEASAIAGAEYIKAATLTTPDQNAARNAYCAAHISQVH